MRFSDLKIASELQSKYGIHLQRAMSRYRDIKNATAEVVGVRLVRKTSTARAHEAIRDLILANPTLSYQQIAGLLGCSRWLVYRVAVEFGVRRLRGAGSPARQQKQGGCPNEETEMREKRNLAASRHARAYVELVIRSRDKIFLRRAFQGCSQQPHYISKLIGYFERAKAETEEE